MKEAWTFFILDLLGHAFMVKAVDFAEMKSLSELKFCSSDMQALAMWAVEVYAEDRWIPEFKSDEKEEKEGNVKVKRQKRKGKSVSSEKLDRYDSLVSHVEEYQQSEHFKGWENAIVDAAKKRLEVRENMRGRKSDSSNTSSGRHKKKLRIVKKVKL